MFVIYDILKILKISSGEPVLPKYGITITKQISHLNTFDFDYKANFTGRGLTHLQHTSLRAKKQKGLV